MKEVTLMQMLVARENRVFLQNTLLDTWHKPVISFTMNIPGPVKYTALISRSFHWGLSALQSRLPKGAVLEQRVMEETTGCTALLAVDMTAGDAKRICVGIEECCPMGRLFDMDVLTEDGEKLDREHFGGSSRNCIVCHQPGRGCASRRVHSIEELQGTANQLMESHFRELDAEKIGTLAVKALLDEVCTSPKPGLVDRDNSGSHQDMDLFTFLASAASLTPYYIRCAAIGMETADSSPEATFSELRKAGLLAEQTMWEATGGINTHKGAIFTMGLLCGAAGRLHRPEWGYEDAALCREVAAMTTSAMEADLRDPGHNTAGEYLYVNHGIRGVRGEAARGLPSVLRVGLPAFRRGLSRELSRNDAGVYTLLALISQVEDTNLLHRGGAEKASRASNYCKTILENFVISEVRELDGWFVRENLSPGGCADLLAAVYFLFDLCN